MRESLINPLAAKHLSEPYVLTIEIVLKSSLHCQWKAAN